MHWRVAVNLLSFLLICSLAFAWKQQESDARSMARNLKRCLRGKRKCTIYLPGYYPAPSNPGASYPVVPLSARSYQPESNPPLNLEDLPQPNPELPPTIIIAQYAPSDMDELSGSRLIIEQ